MICEREIGDGLKAGFSGELDLVLTQETTDGPISIAMAPQAVQNFLSFVTDLAEGFAKGREMARELGIR